MSISISYSSLRSEVWRWYWRNWKSRLWKTHLAVFVSTAILTSFAVFGGLPDTPAGYGLTATVGLVPLIGMALYPMLKFKPQMRVLTADEEGISTSVGKVAADIPWYEIATVADDGEALVIQRRNLNAFIVPARAFTSAEERSQFRAFVLDNVRGSVR